MITSPTHFVNIGFSKKLQHLILGFEHNDNGMGATCFNFCTFSALQSLLNYLGSLLSGLNGKLIKCWGKKTINISFHHILHPLLSGDNNWMDT